MRTNLLLCLSAVLLAGCAGLITPFVNNKYAGIYDGTFSTSDGKAGTATIQLTKIGNIFGTFTASTSGGTGSLTGSVNTNLNFTGNVSFPDGSHNLSASLGANNGEVAGTLTGSDGYSMTIAVNNRVGSGSTTTTTTTSGNPFAGSWIASNGNKATIDSSGNFSAVVKDLTAGTDTLKGTVSAAGVAICTGTNSLAPTGTVSGIGQAVLSGANLEVNIALNNGGVTKTGNDTFSKQSSGS